jgi:hypothetical protein
MKSFFQAAKRFLVSFLGIEFMLALIFSLSAILDNKTGVLISVVLPWIFACIPVSFVVSLFVTFFSLNRLVSKRLPGFAILMCISIPFLCLMAFCLRTFNIAEPAASGLIPHIYHVIALWFFRICKADIPEFSLSLLAFSVFLSAFWGITRLSRNRPLIGAFIAPNASFLALYICGLFLTGAANTLFIMIGLSLPEYLPPVILLFSTGLMLLLLDSLICLRPQGSNRNG